MKKLLCVFLALLLTAFACVPAAAADLADSDLPAANFADPSDNDGVYEVTFTQPSNAKDGYFLDGYYFAPTLRGEFSFVVDESDASEEWKKANDYLYDERNDRFVLAKDVYAQYYPEDPVYYTMVKMEEKMTYKSGDVVTFKVVTSPKFNLASAKITANGEYMQPNALGEYFLEIGSQTEDIVVRVIEQNANGEDVLLRNHFLVYLPKGEDKEYRCSTLENSKYSFVYYGDSFDFRLVLADDAVASDLTVSVTRGSSALVEELGFDPNAFLGQLGLDSGLEVLQSYGTDASGARLYRIENVTTAITINVDGVQLKEDFSLMNLLMRILRLICNLLGFNVPFLQDMSITYNVAINNENDDVQFAVLQGSTQAEIFGNVYAASADDCISIVVYNLAPENAVSVTWTPGNENGTYAAVWEDAYDLSTGTHYQYAIFNIDNINTAIDVTIE